MSLWGATVITNLMSAIPWLGQEIVEFIWGGFSVNNATLNRFFALHFLMPFVLATLVILHLVALHDSAGSNNPLGLSANYDRISFSPYFIFKDLITVFLFIMGLSLIVFFMPNILGDSENYVMANPMQTPAAIVPEWYLLPFYAILRSIPNKLVGVIAMFASIVMLLTLSFSDLGRSRSTQFKPIAKIGFFVFVANFVVLMLLGAKHVESPFIELGQISTTIYFLYFLFFIPLVNISDNTISKIWDLEGEVVLIYNSMDNKQVRLAIFKSLLHIIVFVIISLINIINNIWPDSYDYDYLTSENTKDLSDHQDSEKDILNGIVLSRNRNGNSNPGGDNDNYPGSEQIRRILNNDNSDSDSDDADHVPVHRRDPQEQQRLAYERLQREVREQAAREQEQAARQQEHDEAQAAIQQAGNDIVGQRDPNTGMMSGVGRGDEAEYTRLNSQAVAAESQRDQLEERRQGLERRMTEANREQVLPEIQRLRAEQSQAEATRDEKMDQTQQAVEEYNRLHPNNMRSYDRDNLQVVDAEDNN